MSDITLTDITNATTGEDGTGSFDVLMQAVQRHIVEQYDEGRIVGPDYATVYLGSLQSVLEASIAYVMQQEKAGHEADIAAEGVNEAKAKTDNAIAAAAKTYADISLVDQKTITELAQTTDSTGGLTKDKQDLVKAQTLGFASDTKQKVLKQMLDGYAVTLSIAGTATVPDATKDVAIDEITQEILNDVGSPIVIP